MNTQSNATHTPTPWYVGFSAKDSHYVTHGDGFVVAHVCPNGNSTEANAAFIVRACNSHAQLVAALSAMYCAGFWSADELPNLPDYQRKAIELARAALTAAQS